MENSFTKSQMIWLEKKYDFKTAKSLGQNFVTDPEVTENILRAAGATKEDLVIEIGPGLGVISAGAAEMAGKLVAVEIDKKLLPILGETIGWRDNVKIVNEDILNVDLCDIIDAEKMLPNGAVAKSVKVIGNLPYYITTPILQKLMAFPELFESITIMVQKEVAEKMMAGAGAKNYGVISVNVNYYCDIEYVCDVPKEVFLPRPKVDSSVLKLTLKKDKGVHVEDEELFFEVVKAGFGQRRKTLNNSLCGVRGADKERVLKALTASGIDPMRRAETLSIAEFAELSNCLL